MSKNLKLVLLFCFLPVAGWPQNKFNGPDMNIGSLYRLSDAKYPVLPAWRELEVY